MKKKITLLKVFMTLCLLLVSFGNAWGESTVLFHETFGDNSGSARAWSDTYSVKSGVNDVYSGVSYTMTNVKQGKNTTGQTKSGLNQSTQNVDAVFEFGPLNVSNYKDLNLSYYWKAASIKGTYTTKIYYKTSKDGSYTVVSPSAEGATTFVQVSENLPEVANKVSTLYLKIVFNTSNSQAIIDEVELTGTQATSTKTLTSIAISGTPDKTTYEAGEEFDPAGLVVTGTYDDKSTAEITSGITWEVTPSGALTAGTTSVKVKATVGEITSPEYEVTGLTVNARTPYTFGFETETSLDWNFDDNKMISMQTHQDVTAHGGSYFGTTGGKETASMTTKEKVANPGTLTCYVSKQTTNTTSSTWKVQVSSDNQNWTDVKSQDATSMTKGNWVEFTGDLSSYSNVYVRIYYSGSTAVRCIDDVSLTLVSPLKSIAVKDAPTTTTYKVGDKFAPAGLVITATYDDESTKDIAYSDETKDDFTFSPDLNTALKTENTSVAITYGGKTCSQTITVNKIATSLVWSASSYEATISEQNEYPTLTTTPANLEDVTYSSSNTDVATIDASTGEIELIAAGETTITASFAGDDTYQPATDATYTLTVKKSEDTRTPVNITNVSAGQTTLVKDETTTLTVTNDQLDWTPSYIYESNKTDVATVSTDGVITAVGKGVATITVTLNIEETDPSYRKGEKPSMEIEITVNNPSHTAKFSVNGIIDESMNFTAEEGDKISFPGNPSAIDKYVFKGWYSTTLEPQQKEPTYINTENVTMGTEDITYYAVFVKKEGTEPTLTKLGEDATFSNGDNIVIVATGDSWAKALYQETVSTSYVNFYEFVNNVTEIIADEKNYVTLTGSDNETWELGDATNGYVYNETSNNLTVDKNNSSNWTIVWDGSKSKYSIKNGTRWLSCRSDLNGDNQYKFRGGGTTTSNGTVYFDIYKLIIGTVTFSNYCTTVSDVATIPVTIKSSGKGSFCSTVDLDFTATAVKAYIAVDADNEQITLNKRNKIPAGTGIFVIGDAGNYNIPIATGDCNDVTGNKLIGTIVPYTVKDKDNIWVLSNGKLHPVQEGVTIGAGKAYLNESHNSASLSLFIVDEPTGVEEIKSQSTVNGQQSTAIFNLQGMRVATPKKGEVYIMNGKKFLMK